MNYGKTILAWLLDLPEGYKELALDVRDKHKDNFFLLGIVDALGLFCTWSKTPQGSMFWGKVSDYY
jgi:hypothetical protein